MKRKNVFINKSFKLGLLIFLCLLIVINSYACINGNEKAIIPILIQIFIIALLVNHHKYIKPVLKIWSGLFMIFLPLIIILSQLVKFIIDDKTIIDFSKIIKAFLYLIIGIIIFYLTKKLVTVQNGHRCNSLRSS